MCGWTWRCIGKAHASVIPGRHDIDPGDRVAARIVPHPVGTDEPPAIGDVDRRAPPTCPITWPALAWIAGKLGELRLRREAEVDAALAPREGLETLALGIAGKDALWQALAIVASEEPPRQVE